MRVDIKNAGFALGAAMFVSTLGSPAIARADGGSGCQFTPDVQPIVSIMPDKIGNCVTNLDGEGAQQTTKGLLVVLGKYQEFTDGYRTYALGPNGLQTRLNDDRQFDWEKDLGKFSSYGLTPEQVVARAETLVCEEETQLCPEIRDGQPRFEDFNVFKNIGVDPVNDLSFVRVNGETQIHLNKGVDSYPYDLIAGLLAHEGENVKNLKQNVPLTSQRCYDIEGMALGKEEDLRMKVWSGKPPVRNLYDLELNQDLEHYDPNKQVVDIRNLRNEPYKAECK